ncbi:MAG TPA: serine hydrolase domain-containing protein [Verrucomicrobiae bacterium]|nr:serine hydrolase domain-containing protein [Verrucomicrobiae bacterium]
MKSLERAEAIDDVLVGGLERRFTAAVARVERGGHLVYERALGRTRLDAPGRPIYVDTRFDLASLTKLFVTTLALDLVARGMADLDVPLAAHIPEWREDEHATITMRMLLAHTSGMDSGADYRLLLDARVSDFALRRPLVARPGERVVYSDLGLIAAGVAIERISGRSLPAALAESLPSGAGFNPRSLERATIPATEEDGWRGRVQGSVHDEKSHLMQGVSGHAGLFGSAADVARLTEIYLAAACGRNTEVLPPALARDAITCAADDPVLRRGLGWALKTTDENSCGARFSQRSFGHTGFTGTCVWADPERDLQAVLLTNAVYFGREDSRPLRAAFYDAVIETFGV